MLKIQIYHGDDAKIARDIWDNYNKYPWAVVDYDNKGTHDVWMYRVDTEAVSDDDINLAHEIRTKYGLE